MSCGRKGKKKSCSECGFTFANFSKKKKSPLASQLSCSSNHICAHQLFNATPVSILTMRVAYSLACLSSLGGKKWINKGVVSDTALPFDKFHTRVNISIHMHLERHQSTDIVCKKRWLYNWCCSTMFNYTKRCRQVSGSHSRRVHSALWSQITCIKATKHQTVMQLPIGINSLSSGFQK